MRIAFFIGTTRARNMPWNGYEIRYGGAAVSGSDQSAVLYAEYLASRGHVVHYYSETCKDNTEYKGVHYFNSFRSLDYDAMVILFDFLLTSMPQLKKVIVYCQCPSIPNRQACERFRELNPGCKMLAVHVSEWGKRATLHNSPHYSNFIEKDAIIYNPLMMDVFESVPEAPRIPRSCIFHATWDRGGIIARRVHDRLGFSSFKSFNYYTKDMLPDQSCGDKRTIFSDLSQSDYFIYPLSVTPARCVVHKDTFACVVAEALAMGVIVVSWKVAALPELYDGLVQFAEWPKGANVEGLTSVYDMKDPTLVTGEAVQNLAAVVEALEADPARKERLREAGKKFVRERYTVEAGGPLWEALLS